MSKLMCVSLLLLLLVFDVLCGQPPVRQTANGPVQGVERTSSLGQKYQAFLGIPFAEPPITGTDPYTGQAVDRRFKAPEPLKRTWTENYVANKFGDSCIPSSTAEFQATTPSENCLTLNIYVPDGGANNKTVIVSIYGGSFTEGEYTDQFYGSDFLLSEDNVFVKMQYRVGIFGFLNLDTKEYSGNMGLKDQQLALKWIFENIENFSGNKSSILLFGISASGASVSYQMLNEESRKYFTRAYSAGGTVFSNFAMTKGNHVKRMEECYSKNEMSQIIEYLKTTDSKILTKCYFDQQTSDWGKALKPKWIPTIELADAENPFLTQTPEKLYESNNAPVIDALFSLSSSEQIMFDPSLLQAKKPLIDEKLEGPMVELPFQDFHEKTYPNEYKEALRKLRQAYFSNVTDETSIIYANIKLMSDINLGYSIAKHFKLQMNANNKQQQKNTYFVWFDVHDELNLMKVLKKLEYRGAAHGDDLCYIYHCHVWNEQKIYDKHLTEKTSSAYKTIDRMVKLVSNFARTGNPTIEGDTPFRKSTASEVLCHEINNNFTTNITKDIMGRLHYNLWTEIENTYNSISKSTTHTL